MKRFLQAVVTLFILALPIESPAFSPDHLNQVTFVNETGYNMIYLFFSPSDSEYWGADILGVTRTLPAGEKLSFYVYYPDECNSFDFLAIDEDGDGYTAWNVELCDDQPYIRSITLSDLAGHFGALEFTPLRLQNLLQHEIHYLFVAPADSASWGIDILDARTILEPGESADILLLRSALEEYYDLLAVNQDLELYRFRFLIDDSHEFNFAVEDSDLVTAEPGNR